MDTKKLDALVEELNAVAKQCEEYDRSEDSALAEFVSDLGYNECEYTTEHLTDEAREALESLSKTDARQAVLECSHVELVGAFYQDNEVFSAPLGEGEHQLDDTLASRVEELSAEELEYIQRHTDCYINKRYRDLIYLNHGFDRWVLVLNEDLLSVWKPKKRRNK